VTTALTVWRDEESARVQWRFLLQLAALGEGFKLTIKGMVLAVQAMQEFSNAVRAVRGEDNHETEPRFLR
jgi:hypothetical protein